MDDIASQESDATQEAFELNDYQATSSWISRHFKDCVINGKAKIECLWPGCGKQYAKGVSHSLIKRHWHYDHKEPNSRQTSYTFSNDEKIDAIIKFIVYNKQEYSVVEQPSFRALCRVLCPRNPPIVSNNLISNELRMSTIKLTDVITRTLNEQLSIALTFDLWTKRDGSAGFAAVTGHYIDQNFKMVSIVLDFQHIPYPHVATEIKEFLKETILKFGLQKKIIGITTDNGSNVVAAIDQLKFDLNLNLNFSHGFIHFRCINHVLHLSITQALKLLKPLLLKVRTIVTTIRGSTRRRERFIQIQEDLLKTRPNLRFTRPLELVIEVDTRWNSTYSMIKRVIKLREAIDQASTAMPELIGLDGQDWTELGELREFLEPYAIATDYFSAEKRPTLPQVAAFYPKIKSHTESVFANEVLRSSAQSLSNKLLEYSDFLREDMVILATVLDPRFKLKMCNDECDRIHAKQLLKGAISNIDIHGNNRRSSSDSTAGNLSIFADCFDSNRDECDDYLHAPQEGPDLIVLDHWRAQVKQSPRLARLARTLMCLQASSVPSERVFSSAGDVDTPKRNRLCNESFRSNILLNSWLKIIEAEKSERN